MGVEDLCRTHQRVLQIRKQIPTDAHSPALVKDVLTRFVVLIHLLHILDLPFLQKSFDLTVERLILLPDLLGRLNLAGRLFQLLLVLDLVENSRFQLIEKVTGESELIRMVSLDRNRLE